MKKKKQNKDDQASIFQGSGTLASGAAFSSTGKILNTLISPSALLRFHFQIQFLIMSLCPAQVY